MKKVLSVLCYLCLMFMLSSCSLTRPANYYNQAILKAYKSQNWKQMNKLSDAVMENYPNSEFGYFFKGMAMDELGEYKEAIGYYSKAITIKPEFSENYQNRGLAYLHDKQYDNAISDYDKALELNPNNEFAKIQKEIAANEKKGIAITIRGNIVDYQSIHDPYYLANQYKKMPEKKKKEIIKSVKDYSDEVLPIYYVAVSEDIFPKNKNLAAFLYAAGRYRSTQDVMMCTDKSAYGAIQGFPFIAPKTSSYIAKMNDKKRAKLFQKVLNWDEQHPNRPHPEWICYHGMEAFINNGTVKTFPMDQYESKKNAVRESFSQNIEKLKNK